MTWLLRYTLQDRIYDKYVRKSLEDLLQTNRKSSTPSSRPRRLRHRPNETECANQFSTLLANAPCGKILF